MKLRGKRRKRLHARGRLRKKNVLRQSSRRQNRHTLHLKKRSRNSKMLLRPRKLSLKLKKLVTSFRLHHQPENGKVSEHDEAPEPKLNSNSGKKSKESLRIDNTEIPRRRPGPLDLASAKRDVFAPPPSSLLTARVIDNLSEVAYPEVIKSPVELNANVRDGRFRYDRDFLM
ncbi:hypothetical protein EDB19DRAFT_1688908 [Suillus lakei]|nr:hypothetical protein EDB19DRAFT_1688908 [Suillus lakei]